VQHRADCLTPQVRQPFILMMMMTASNNRRRWPICFSLSRDGLATIREPFQFRACLDGQRD
jgi:hypothetical protein